MSPIRYQRSERGQYYRKLLTYLSVCLGMLVLSTLLLMFAFLSQRDELEELRSEISVMSTISAVSSIDHYVGKGCRW